MVVAARLILRSEEDAWADRMTISQILAEGRATDLRPSDFPLVFDVALVARCGCDPSECETHDCLHLGYLSRVPDTPHNRERYPGSRS